MATLVLGIGSSHTPLLTLEPDEWRHRAEADIKNPKLNLSDGRWVTYAELLAEFGPRHAEDIRPEELQRKHGLCERALDRLADALESAATDVVIIVGDDQGEMFGSHNQPALGVCPSIPVS